MMPEHWVLNASPLISLARIDRHDLFFSLADQVVVPQAVADEISAGPAEDNARKLILAGKFTVVDVLPPPAGLIAWDLGRGETAVISLAMAERRWTVILDDAAARKCARSFSLRMKGTLSIVLMAKRRGIIPSAVDLLRSLRANGFRLDDRLVREALHRSVGESWD